MENILVTDNLCKNFKRQKANDNISITVRKDSIYGLLGPNGAGKSTLLKLITGMLNPSSGQIYFNGKAWERSDLMNIGALIESPPIYENLTALENLKVRALLNNPKLLIFDEPTNGLDPIGVQDLRNLICSFPKKGITVILSSHILSEVEQIVDDIGIIANGKLWYQDSIEKTDDLESLFMNVVRKAAEYNV